MDRIFYKSPVSDAYTGYPIYIFDTSYLPSPEEVDYNLFLPSLMVLLPEEAYVVVVFNGGLNKINWVWGIKFLRSFLVPDSKNVRSVDKLHMVIAVHESWFVRSLSQIFTNFAFSKWANLNFLSDSRKKNLLVSCATLSDLHLYVDITTLKLSLNVYVHDTQIAGPDTGFLSAVPPAVSPLTTFNCDEFPLFYYNFYQIFHIVNTYAANVELLFHRPGNKLHTAILYNCMLRNQRVWINDWDLNCIASCFKKLLKVVHGPLIDVDLIPLPVRDDAKYTADVFALLMEQRYANEVLFQMLDLCHRILVNNEITHHILSSLLRSLCPVLTQEPIFHDNKPRIAVSLRFFQNLLAHWQAVRKPYEDRFYTVQEVVVKRVRRHHVNLLFISYDMTIYHSEMSAEPLDNASVCLEKAVDAERVRNEDACQNSNYTRRNSKDGGDRPPRGEQVPTRNAEPDAATAQKIAPHDQSRSGNAPSEPGDAVSAGSDVTDQLALSQLNTSCEAEVALQFPPQKYRFERNPAAKIREPKLRDQPKMVIKKPVVRGRKVGQLTRLFEQRAEAMQILQDIDS